MLKFILLWMLEGLWCLSNLIIKPKMISYQKGFQREINCGNFNAEAYRYMTKQPFLLRSDYGYALSCELIYPNKGTKERADSHDKNGKGRKIAVLCHGFGCAKYGSVKYVDMFLRLGFLVIIYDHRNHGLSGKAYTSMGYYEKYDLKKIVDWCFDKFGKDCRIVTHGESMGGATVLLHQGIDDRVRCVIADCAYSDLVELLHHQLKQYYHLPRCILPLESYITYLRAGFRYEDVSPIEAVKNSVKPILFIHGKIDNYVPSWMSRQMYQAKKNNKAIYLVAGARHAASYCRNRAGYEKRVKEFLEHYL